MRFIVLSFVLLAISGCSSANQSIGHTESFGVVGYSLSAHIQRGGDGSYQLEANEPLEILPTDGLYVRFRVPPGWTVSLIQHNYISFRSGRDTAFIMVMCSDGSVQWGVTYYDPSADPSTACEMGYDGEPASDGERSDSYQSYMDDTEDSVFIYVNWPDIDAIHQFAQVLALREGGSCEEAP